ncbi:MAG: penicillin-insensitive murein endopeptidase [Bradymonadia bacterium]
MLDLNATSLRGSILLLWLVTLTPHITSARGKTPRWHTVDGAAAGASEAIGGYSKGCLQGGVSVGPTGKGFQIIRLERNRSWGHPTLATFVEGYGARLDAAGLPPALIGDLAQPRGGRMPSDHRSHQTGLDVDVWFSRPEGPHPLPRTAVQAWTFPDLADKKTEEIHPDRLTKDRIEMLRLAAEDDTVARIFVSYVIKGALCAQVKGDRSWLRKIRPWWGHRAHFHVRLHCPEGSPDCVPQKTLPPGDGCDVWSWFTRAEVAARKARGEPKYTPPKIKRPRRCRQVLKARKARSE